MEQICSQGCRVRSVGVPRVEACGVSQFPLLQSRPRAGDKDCAVLSLRGEAARSWGALAMQEGFPP